MTNFPDDLRPFALAGRGHLDRLPEHVGPFALDRLDALDPANAPFALALNRANCLAYDGTPTLSTAPGALGMPQWVLLDCCMLPSAVFGFSLPATAVDPHTRTAIDPDHTSPRIAVSEYIGIPGLHPDTIIGASLFSLLPGLHLGRRTKALALLACNFQRQVGVTQWTNPSIRLHLAFGPLNLLQTRVQVHSRADETFVYGLTVPPRPTLDALVRGHRTSTTPLPPADFTVDPRLPDDIARIRNTPTPLAIVSAGPIDNGQLTRIGLRHVRPDTAPEWRSWTSAHA